MSPGSMSRTGWIRALSEPTKVDSMTRCLDNRPSLRARPSRPSHLPLGADLPVLALLLAVLVLAGCAEEPPAAEKKLRPVRFQEVEAGTGSRLQTYAGVARAGEEIGLSFRVSGTLNRLPVKLGQRVSRGQDLAGLDPSDFELQVEQGAASLAQAEAALRQAEAGYERARSLYENQNASKADLESARAAAESAEAQTRAARKKLDQVERQLTYTRLTAPIDGHIAALEAERNESVQAGRPVMVLTSLGRPEVKVSMPEVMVGQVEDGMATTVRFDALPDRVLGGKVTEVAVASLGGSTFEVTVELDEDVDAVRSGMAADVTFSIRDGGSSGIAVPQLAVGEDPAGNFVFVLNDHGDGTGQVERRAVEVGDFVGGGLQILSGLEVGEKVVTAGVRRLSDGMEVKVSEIWGETP